MGIDGGGLDDLLGLALLGREAHPAVAPMVQGLGKSSVPDRRKSEASLLRDFEAAGELVICKEFGEDISEITQLAIIDHIQRARTEFLSTSRRCFAHYVTLK